MSDTPRTNELKLRGLRDNLTPRARIVAYHSLCETLECELTASRAEVERLRTERLHGRGAALEAGIDGGTMADVITALHKRAESAQRALAGAQAKIDALMLEYCPDEMTHEQVENWGKHQRALSEHAAPQILDPSVYDETDQHIVAAERKHKR